ncbi:hypothetical protein ACK9YZ_05400 [Rhizobium sp. ZK1]|uniref:hypothetical protein n=1 Tax=Rhizobium sp. ZK1 TaxID=3389872 RepID=UPI0039F6D08F
MKKRPSIAVNFAPRPVRVENSNSPEPQLVQRFVTQPGVKPQDISFDRLRGRPELTRLIAKFIRVTNSKNAPSTRMNTVKFFRYLYEFLDSWEELFGRHVGSMDGFDQKVLDGYWYWLDGDDNVGSVLRLANITKNQRYGCVRRFLQWASDVGATSVLGKEFLFHPPWPEQNHDPKPLKLSRIEVSLLFNACKRVITEAVERLEVGHAAVQTSNIVVPELHGLKRDEFKNFEVKLKSAHAAMHINLLSGRFREEMPGLARALRKPYGSVEEVIDHLYLTTDTLLPFLILIGLPTCFNEVGLVFLRWSNIQEREGLLGGTRIYIKAEKRRSGHWQQRSFAIDDDPFGVGSLLKRVKKLTALTHNISRGKYDDLVFLPFRRRGGGPRPFWNGHFVDTGLARALEQFRKRFDLPPFTLNDLRTIGGDIASEMSQGDLLIQQIVQQHRTSATTDGHYETARQFRERQESLAHTIGERERIILSSGKVDTRNQGGRRRLYSAATPGFDCDDPHDSPIRGQRKGTLCAAYGKCFACPLASMAPTDRNAVRLVQFKAAFKEARMKMTAARWIVEWERERRALHDFWLPQFGRDLLKRADVRTLPPVPPIE